MADTGILEKVKGLFSNFKKEKITSASGIAMLVVFMFRLFGVDSGQIYGIDVQVIAEIIGALFNAILLLVSKDPTTIASDNKKS